MDAVLTERKRSFAPVVNQHVRVLILGSLPGEISLLHEQYYAHPQNQFWRLLSDTSGCDLVTQVYPQRLQSLLALEIGLWDVVAEALRQGSLDSQIRYRDDNDLIALCARLPSLQTIAFNGATAARIGTKILGRQAERYRILRLPSSSPAYTLAYADKLVQWQMLWSE